MRVLANIVPNEYWMGTMLHELGHSVYSSKNIPRSVPYVLRSEAHILTTEGVAMMFERFTKGARLACRRWASKSHDPQAFDAGRRQDAAQPAADLLALVPGDAAVREGACTRTPTRT